MQGNLRDASSAEDVLAYMPWGRGDKLRLPPSSPVPLACIAPLAMTWTGLLALTSTSIPAYMRLYRGNRPYGDIRLLRSRPSEFADQVLERREISGSFDGHRANLEFEFRHLVSLLSMITRTGYAFTIGWDVRGPRPAVRGGGCCQPDLGVWGMIQRG